MLIFAVNKMLEIYNAVIRQGESTPVNDLSLMVADGQRMCVAGSGETATLIFRALLGLVPLQCGHISVDGELLTPLSAPYFRQMMTYVPKEVTLPDRGLSLGYVVTMLMRLHAQLDVRWNRDRIERIWKEKLNLPYLTFATRWLDVPPMQRYLIHLSLATLTSRQIILIDEPAEELDAPSRELANQLILEMTADNTCLLIASNHPLVQQLCNSTIQI